MTIKAEIQDVAGDEARNAAGRNTSENTGEHMIPKSRFDELNERLKNTMARADALEKAAREEAEQRLQEANDYKALWESQQAELAQLKPKAEQVQQYEATLQSVLDAQVSALPDDKRALVPDALTTQQKLDWISKNRAALAAITPPDIGAGRQGGGKMAPKVDLTDEEKEAAARFGMTIEEYAKFK